MKQQIPNTFGIKVYANQLLHYRSVEELQTLIQHKQLTAPLLHIGAGSNLLFTRDFEGTVLHSEIRFICVKEEDEEQVLLRVGAGICWDELVEYAVAHGWQGIENLSLIPGEVGSAAVQNIGAYGAEVADVIYRVHGVDLQTGELRCWNRSECRYSYRYSLFKQPEMKRFALTEVEMRLSKRGTPNLSYRGLAEQLARNAAPCTLQAVRQAVIDLRRSKLPDPAELGNAGSFFTNPMVSPQQAEALKQRYPQLPVYPAEGGNMKLSAGWLIEQCGWKQRGIGDAAVYEKQALVLINRGNATGADIYHLSEEIIRSVEEKFGVHLVREVNVF